VPNAAALQPPRRSWSVEARSRQVRCSNSHCPGPVLTAGGVRAAALTHLAWHARTEPLPDHLRTCECRAHGCTWHPRRRGCEGPVVLALFHRGPDRTWNLADVCHGCLKAIPQAARVPETPADPTPLPSPLPRRLPAKEPRLERVTATLSYLAAALPDTRADARLLALVCVMQADTRGRVVLPGGLRRGLRLRGSGEDIAALVRARWINPPAGWDNAQQPSIGGPLTVVIRDFAALGSPLCLSSRARAAVRSWCWRTLTHPCIRHAPADIRLAALAIAALADRRTDLITLDTATLEHICAPAAEAERLVVALIHTGWIRSWNNDGGHLRINVRHTVVPGTSGRLLPP
jgi:hypothetical protein